MSCRGWRDDLDYVGSTSRLRGVDVSDVTNGARLTTYAIPGPRGGRDITINGAAAHLVTVGDRVVVVAYGLMSDDEAHHHTPRVVVVDERNDVVEHRTASKDEPR